jgi:hypothetical protein
MLLSMLVSRFYVTVRACLSSRQGQPRANFQAPRRNGNKHFNRTPDGRGCRHMQSVFRGTAFVYARLARTNPMSEDCQVRPSGPLGHCAFPPCWRHGGTNKLIRRVSPASQSPHLFTQTSATVLLLALWYRWHLNS